MDATNISGLHAMVPTLVPAVSTANGAAPTQVPAPVPAAAAPAAAPTPVNFAQEGQVTRSNIPEGLPSDRAIGEPERMLKPYGVAMLPETPTDHAASGKNDNVPPPAD